MERCFDPSAVGFLLDFRETFGVRGSSSSLSLSMMMILRESESPRESVFRELSVLTFALGKRLAIHMKLIKMTYSSRTLKTLNLAFGKAESGSRNDKAGLTSTISRHGRISKKE